MSPVEKTAQPLIGAVDQGTSSTRFLIFNCRTWELITYHQMEILQKYPKEGWVEEDPMEILASVVTCIDKAVENLAALGYLPDQIKAIGITNQRESLVVWDQHTGKPLHPAIIWLDGRTAETVDRLIQQSPGKSQDCFKSVAGLPISTYFTALKMRWLLDNDPNVKASVDSTRCLLGNVDSWLLWNLTGGVDGGKHYTDVTNASRTLLMNLHTLQWDNNLCSFFNISKKILPEIRSSSEIYGRLKCTALNGVPISGILGDQQAALVGQGAFRKGQAKNTYGTGCFLLYNTGTEPVNSSHGLLTTVAYQFGKNQPAHYALEGSVAIAGAAVKWLRDNLGIIKESAEIETLAAQVDDTHGCYFVPAFSGLFCPYWQPDARGIICGLSQFTNRCHIARACLEAVCFQTRELLECVSKDSGIPMTALQVDGGMTANSLLMQLHADLCNINIIRPSMTETTALGAAMAAGCAEGVDLCSIESLEANASITTDSYAPAIKNHEADQRFSRWKNAVQRSMRWELPSQSSAGEIL
ncbi:hypothetical protein CAPTEDRAFT_119584 [Capitella teleta]|uniref:Probable glycerol kinase n=1 Tax=Capitella teleta TaxID=283909 RepID=R7U4H9_CAPTE|nr:hypothetical protein CAPTEDRAFT_119584 [Capitella teleta]|eukprot:ELU01270.1 hypothetical protein CAPTEDRAFT_119584 [Capitella teleta]